MPNLKSLYLVTFLTARMPACLPIYICVMKKLAREGRGKRDPLMSLEIFYDLDSCSDLKRDAGLPYEVSPLFFSNLNREKRLPCFLSIHFSVSFSFHLKFLE